MRFEWDPRKAELNLRKHRLDFARATRVFDDRHMMVDLDRGDHRNEARWIAMGAIEGDIVLVVFTWPEPDDEDVVRLISARRATRREAQSYWKNRFAEDPHTR